MALTCPFFRHPLITPFPNLRDEGGDDAPQATDQLCNIFRERKVQPAKFGTKKIFEKAFFSTGLLPASGLQPAKNPLKKVPAGLWPANRRHLATLNKQSPFVLINLLYI